MTDKEILKQIKGYDKVEPYAVDIDAIRRGKANLALMMTLTTADHYDWFIGKFPSHNFFEFYGYKYILITGFRWLPKNTGRTLLNF